MLHTLMDTPFNGHLVDTSFWDKAKIRRVYCINPEHSPSLGCKVPMTGSIQTGPRKDTWCRWSVWGIDSAPKAGWFHDHWMDVPGRIDWNSMEFLNVGQKICGVPVHLPLDQFCMSKQGKKNISRKKTECWRPTSVFRSSDSQRVVMLQTWNVMWWVNLKSCE